MQDDSPPPSGNIPEFSVSEISFQVKRTVEGAFEHVRVRGEVSRPTRAGSGHVYLTLKDEKSVLDAVCWRGTAQRLSVQPEEGMEVICTGKLTTFPGRSKYQMVIEQMELAGEGALLKLLEERKKKLAAEGLFADERKRPLPFLPKVIGVVTSPTGAVIRDILHRLSDRFPTHVLVWPVLVQGEAAKDQVAAAIEGFNAIAPGGPVPRPDLLIVARGGGSLEDLWAFNEEIVVRAAAASEIPLISAVGHETDTTLIDFASDRRAPTPTAAAEMAVPVRAELLATLMQDESRLFNGLQRKLGEAETRLTGLARGLGDPRSIIEAKAQTVDYRWQTASAATDRMLSRLSEQVRDLAAQIPEPAAELGRLENRFVTARQKLDSVLDSFRQTAASDLRAASVRLRLEPVADRMTRGARDAGRAWVQIERAVDRILVQQNDRLTSVGRILESNSYEQTLKRGFALVRDADGAPVTRAASLSEGDGVSIHFGDGSRDAVIGAGSPDGPEAKPSPPKQTAKPKAGKTDPAQGSLL
ncbi:exodeoxyribonuclease VII large subunit [Nisaea acidiphila]|uniref:Exodeoxyribonuclease 7 large subunit n=1 Tax=Nisaea acidiphila TaxID=1862145 RepID=A0A9J7AKQ6_9PROT|nr:exodeoxyribonuclease VII large subunit [Nisaea acidiphila]UUX48235.1 exodeoxyribonuclease VII large subunit [Nisaea acidiphila]